MVRWRYCLVLAVLLLLPLRTYEADEEDEDEESDNNEEVEDEDDENEADDQGEKPSERDKSAQLPAGRRSLTILVTNAPTTTTTYDMTRTAKRRPLECYVCAYKAEAPLRACLDPAKFRVHTITCHSLEDKCFTTAITKGSSYEAVVRGCRTSCTGTPGTTCCEMNRCNSQAFVVPVAAQRALAATTAVVSASNKIGKPISQTVFFFVTVLLVLQTVVKVAFI